MSNAALKLGKMDFGGTYRSDEDVNLMVLANLHGGYAEVMSCGDVLRPYTAIPLRNECSPAQPSPDQRSVFIPLKPWTQWSQGQV